MKRSGTADLPLHGGHVPQWLAERMTKLGTVIAEAIIHDYGTSAFLSRLSDPFWFQALGAVMGMDWHSSGITTSVMGALKRGLGPGADEIGIYVCGGRGRFSRNTPQELRSIAERRGFDGEALVRASRLAARVDNNAIGDGFQIYLHSFVLASNGEWAVVQQGLNDRSGMARRYHWHSARLKDFVAEPHTGIVGENQGLIMNLVDVQAKPAQSARFWKSPAKSRRRRWPPRVTCACQTIMRCARRTSISSVWARCLRSPMSATYASSPSCCCSKVSVHARFSRSL
jgi:uncharacterized protein